MFEEARRDGGWSRKTDASWLRAYRKGSERENRLCSFIIIVITIIIVKSFCVLVIIFNENTSFYTSQVYELLVEVYEHLREDISDLY